MANPDVPPTALLADKVDDGDRFPQSFLNLAAARLWLKAFVNAA